ncbi:hypothetical protein BB561_003717 [Smittium simulii]|uniref:Extracellular metalloproteinase n=1 Tax=Smittium simulii TaxID=133385 RepID=A0A2T9YJX0_9FUNG|nr:hypothetical protein BB561_003717 [Smittium simulii]
MNAFIFTIFLTIVAFAVSHAAIIDNKDKSFDSTQYKFIDTFGPNLYKQRRFFDYTDKSLQRNISYRSNYNVSDIKDAKNVAFEHIFTTLGYTANDYVVKNAYQTSHNGITHIYMKQVVKGLEISNGDLNINIDKFGNVISGSSTFYKSPSNVTLNFSGNNHIQKNKLIHAWAAKNINKPSGFVDLYTDKISRNARKSQIEFDFITLKQAVDILSKHLGQDIRTDINRFANHQSNDGYKDTHFNNNGTSNHYFEDGIIRVKPTFMHLESGDIEPVWNLLVKQKTDVWDVFVSAVNGDIVSILSWTSNASYRVYPFGNSNPSVTQRNLVVDPQNLIASPIGWHAPDDSLFPKTTIGNNVFVQRYTADQTPDKMYRPVSENLTFDYPINLEQTPDTYTDATLTHIFYTLNMMHDLMYQYGFNEIAGNFQQNNHNQGGLGSDPLIVYAQDSRVETVGAFIGAPDGSAPVMMLGLIAGNPIKDVALDNDVIVHEFTHGVCGRLVGGANTNNCLTDPDTRGLDEGWADFVAVIVRIAQGDNRNTVFYPAEFLFGQNNRKFPYTTDIGINTATFDYLNKKEYQDQHSKGVVWATILYEMLWDLIDQDGFSPDLMAHNTNFGNVIALQIVIDAMKLSQCNPTFIGARDDILTAYTTLTGKENACDIWGAFARRGLGDGAKKLDNPKAEEKVYIESKVVPASKFLSRKL